MRYPIDVEEWVREFRRVRPDATPKEEAQQRDHIVPLVNMAYDDGLHDLGGFPIADGELIGYLEMRRGCVMDERLRKYISAWMSVCNDAYEAGVRERGRGGGV